MGSYFSLEINNTELIIGKSYINPFIGILFTQNEKQVINHSNYEIDGEIIENYKQFYYKSTVEKLLKRLKILGITLKKTREHFDLILNDTIEYYKDGDEFWGNELLKEITYDTWCKRIKSIIEKK